MALSYCCRDGRHFFCFQTPKLRFFFSRFQNGAERCFCIGVVHFSPRHQTIGDCKFRKTGVLRVLTGWQAQKGHQSADSDLLKRKNAVKACGGPVPEKQITASGMKVVHFSPRQRVFGDRESEKTSFQSDLTPERPQNNLKAAVFPQLLHQIDRPEGGHVAHPPRSFLMEMRSVIAASFIMRFSSMRFRASSALTHSK